MKRLTGLALSTAILFLLGACSIGSSIQPEPTATPENQATASEPSSTPTTTLSNGQTGPLTLRIWVPPAFSPDPANEAGALLKARLDEFVLLHPGVRVTVRIKAETGTGGMIRSLEAMSVAVPDALPDLILASRPELERAASSGLLDSYSDLGQGWYGFAPGLSQYASQVIGLPFAADALVLLYRADTLSDPPSDWDRTLDFKSPLLFAAGDHWSLFTLALYLSAGGTFMDESGNPAINPFNMAEVFQYYRQGHEVGIFHDWMAGLEGQEDVYKSLQAGSFWAIGMLISRSRVSQPRGANP
jgi:multiple sugar transport system substrate-binding protein